MHITICYTMDENSAISDFTRPSLPHSSTTSSNSTQSTPGNSFPVILYTILERSEDDRYAHIISWRSHGKSFHVHNKDRFVNEVLPMYSRQTRFSSFQRQLNLYGFRRITKRGPDYGSYYHEFFVRGRADLLHHIQRPRLTAAGNTERSSPEPTFEPDKSTSEATKSTSKQALSTEEATADTKMPASQEQDLTSMVSSMRDQLSSSDSQSFDPCHSRKGFLESLADPLAIPQPLLGGPSATGIPNIGTDIFALLQGAQPASPTSQSVGVSFPENVNQSPEPNMQDFLGGINFSSGSIPNSSGSSGSLRRLIEKAKGQNSSEESLIP